MIIKKVFLLIAGFTVVIIALLYGVAPHWFARLFLGINDVSIEFAHILRSIMGLYLALGLFWLWAAFRDKYRNMAVLTTMIFAGGLVSGRLISVVVDGQPSPVLVIYIILEFVFVPVSYWVFRLPEK